MDKLFLIFLVLALAGCKETAKKSDNIKDSTRRTDSIMAAADRLDDEQTSPSQAEERDRILKTYNDIQVIDTLLISGKDILHLRLKYYCLKNSKLIIPKRYQFEEKPQKDFVTHEFATDILLVTNKDTVLNKQFKANDFNAFYKDVFAGNLKKYGSIIDMPSLSTKSINVGVISLGYSIAIPTTDLGISLTMMIRKDGQFKITADQK